MIPKTVLWDIGLRFFKELWCSKNNYITVCLSSCSFCRWPSDRCKMWEDAQLVRKCFTIVFWILHKKFIQQIR